MLDMDNVKNNMTLSLAVAYNGKPFSGFARQPGQLTVQGELEHALELLFRREVETTCAGRTDAGVHARAQVVSFDISPDELRDRTLESLARSMNALTHEAIVVRSVDERELGFSARFDATEREYRYFICTEPAPPIFLRDFSWHIPKPLDVEAMREASRALIGEHDFKSFCTVRTQAEETVRTIYSLTVTKADDLITIRISGSGFLYNMVRIIAGTLVKIGMGVYPPEKMEEILEEKNRAAAGPTIPARGLTLVSLEYEKELAPYLEGENKHWHYVLDQRNVPEKGLAHLTIERCEPEELDGVLRRVIHQAYRNGAKRVFVRDTFGEEGSICGYYRLRRQPETEEGWLEAVYEGEHR